VSCSNCATENKPGRRFCVECGGPLAAACPVCAAAVEPGEKFCGSCGSPLGSSNLPDGPAPRQTGAERRLVSVMFADLVGFTSLAEGQDAEETRELLSSYFELAADVVARYGGTVEKFIGDAVMAVWGAPTAHEDDAERAVRAALELLDAVHGLGPEVLARAAVLTGEAVVTVGAVNQGLVAGDLVNTASRLQSAAAPGTVLVGEATERAAGRAIAFEPAGNHHLKGKATPIAAWRALRVVAERGGRGRPDSLDPPFVGRDDELRLLKDLYHATSRERRARLVSVIGPGGIGKTRLAWEFLKYLDGLVETVRYHDGRSPAYGDGISFWALGEMVRRRAGLLETDDEPTTRARLAATLAEHVPDEAERRWVEPALLALLGVESEVRSEHLFGAWRTFFERMATSAPVVMVFEDHHFADPGLLDFVDHLLEWSRGVPIYVVTLSRPELLDRRPDWGAGKRNFTSIHLDPLSEPAMRELLAGLVPGLPETVVRSIVTRADGVPLYAVETVRMLLADGRIVLEGNAYRPTGDLTSLAVPDTLTALIASRLDALGTEDRALVSDAAVLGQSFTIAGLAAVSGLTEAELEPHLRSLARRELMSLEADPRSPERGQYAFVQALIREVAYNTLAKADRKRRHLAAARHFEQLGTDELAGGLAGHYLAAHANTTAAAEADALAHQARIALVAAADRAVALGSLEQATAFLRLALGVTRDPAEEAYLLERAGEAASGASRHDEAEELLRRAVDLQRARGDRPATARATAALGRALLSCYRTVQASAVLEAAADGFADLEDDPGYLAVLGQLARACLLTDRDRGAVTIADRALPAAERLDLVGLVADLLVTKGTALGNLGRSYEGSGIVETALHLAERHNLAATAVRARLNFGYLLSKVDPVASLEGQRVGLAEAQRVGQRRFAMLFATNAAADAVRTGDWDWALEVLADLSGGDLAPEDRILVLARITNIRSWRGDDVADEIAEARRLAGPAPDPQNARFPIEAAAIAALVSGAYGDALPGYRVLAREDSGNAGQYLIMAARAALQGRDRTGAALALEALDGIGVHGTWGTSSRTSILAGLAALDGRPADALALYRSALRGLRETGAPLDEALTTIEMATLLDATEPEVEAAAERAREILRRLGAHALLDRLNAVPARR
jgi:class 3 adenylate cyclase/tetratricopeptide (TPR) repeat protein